uniref:CMP-sialic acid transporter n=1 Tax=Oryza barthii TaxID=65489 RepID=A0A0D3F7C2_9ORYZ
MQRNGVVECSVCRSRLVVPSPRSVSRAYDKHRSKISSKFRALNVLLVVGDCILVGLQPILVFMSKVDGKFQFSPISVNFLTEVTKVVFAIVMLIIQWEALALLLIGISINQLRTVPAGNTAFGLPVTAIAYIYTLIFGQRVSVFFEDIQGLRCFSYVIMLRKAFFLHSSSNTILKKYSSTVATIFTGLASAAFLGHTLTINFLLGISVVFISMHQFFSPLAKAKDDKPAELLELEDTQNHRSSESSFVNMTAGAAEDVV